MLLALLMVHGRYLRSEVVQQEVNTREASQWLVCWLPLNTDLGSEINGTLQSARQFASWVGVTPRQVGTGGKTQQLGISKRGDTYLRTLLIAGARAVIARAERSGWITRLLERRHYNVAVVALANKIARTAWAVLAKGAGFDQVKWHPLEQASP